MSSLRETLPLAVRAVMTLCHTTGTQRKTQQAALPQRMFRQTREGDRTRNYAASASATFMARRPLGLCSVSKLTACPSCIESNAPLQADIWKKRSSPPSQEIKPNPFSIFFLITPFGMCEGGKNKAGRVSCPPTHPHRTPCLII